MARRRAVGEAISRNAARFADTILQQRLAEIQMARQMEMERVRQERNQAAQLEMVKTQQALANPQIALRLARSGDTSIPQGWLPTQDEIAAPLMGDINEASTLTTLPSEGALLGQFKGTGGDTSIQPGVAVGRHPFTGRQPVTQGLLDSRNERYKTLLNEESLATTAVDEMDPSTGNTTRSFVPTRGLSALKPVTTALGGEAQGKLDAQRTLAGELSPGVVTARTNAEARMAGARTQAALNVQFSPQNIARQLALTRQEEELKAQIAGDVEGAKMARQAEADSLSAIRAVTQMKELYDKVKSSNALDNLGRTIGGRTGALAYANPAAALLDRQREGFAMVLAPILGVKAPISDRDRESVLELLAGSNTPPAVGDELYTDLSNMLVLGPVAARQLQHLDFQGRLEAVRRWIKLMKEAPPNVDTILDPETGVEFRNVRK